MVSFSGVIIIKTKYNVYTFTVNILIRRAQSAGTVEYTDCTSAEG